MATVNVMSQTDLDGLVSSIESSNSTTVPWDSSTCSMLVDVDFSKPWPSTGDLRLSWVDMLPDIDAANIDKVGCCDRDELVERECRDTQVYLSALYIF